MSTSTTQTLIASTAIPSRMPIDIERYPKLSREQAGHLRHFHNLAAQKDGEWNHMGAQEPMQEFLDAYRYQLATMVYASSVAHYHHMPVLRSVFKTLIRRLIHKMLRREVWGYWFNTSMSGKLVDPDLPELRKPWADPVVRENIMYSGHLLLMVSLYAMLFDDDEFEREGGLEFKWNPIFWGMGPETFSYSTQTLQDAIMREMDRTGYLGVCCEPNMVFIICNQFPIIAVHYNDVRHNKHEADKLLEKYQAAWQKKGGFVGPNGQYYGAWMERQNVLVPSPGPSSTAWASAFMNAWNPDFVKSSYEAAALGHITNTEGLGIRYHPPPLGNKIQELVAQEGASPTAKLTLDRAKDVVREEKKSKTGPSRGPGYDTPEFGYVMQWISELGKESELQGLLKYADERLRPTWENGGLFYPRHDELWNDDMELKFMDPYTGNAAIGYARLNVTNGQRKMYEAPWTRETLKARPWVDGVQLDSGVDFLRGAWDAERSCLALTMRTWDASKQDLGLVFRNLSDGLWKVYVDGEVVKETKAKQGDDLDLTLNITGDERDVVLWKEPATVPYRT